MRLETILQTVKKTDALYQEKNYGNFLAFEPVTLVPFEPHLIDYNLLSEDQIKWLNDYNRLTREKVGAELEKQKKTRYLGGANSSILSRILPHSMCYSHFGNCKWEVIKKFVIETLLAAAST